MRVGSIAHRDLFCKSFVETHRKFEPEQLPWPQRDHALFVGFAPVSAPRYAVAVVVEHGGTGSAVAGPIARDILLETQTRDPSRALQRVAGL